MAAGMISGVSEALLAREGELAALDEMIRGVAAERGSTVLIEGAAGIGKTALFAAAAELAAQAEVSVMRARASELDRGFAQGVVRQLFEPALAAADERERERLLGGAAAPASFLLPGPGGGAAEEFAVLHGLHWFVLNLATRGPVLLMVDDLHWADIASLRFLEHLARRLEGTSVGLIATLRPAEPGAAHHVLDELAAGPQTQVLRPAALGDGAVGTLLAATLGVQPEPAFAAAAARATGGNPLLTSVLAREAAAGGLHGLASEGARLDELGGRGVEVIVRRRLRTLGPECEALAQAVAVAGPQLGAAELARLSGLDTAAALDARADLVRVEVLAERGGEFVHPLVRAAVLAACAPSRRSQLHGAVAAQLRLRGDRPSQIAVHLVHAAPTGDPGAVDVLRAAARSALDEGAPETAADLLERALAEPPLASLRTAVELDLGELEVRVGRLAGASRLRGLIDDGLSGDDAARAHAALGNQLVHTDPVGALDELERAAADARDPQLALQLEAHALEAMIYTETFAPRRDARLTAGAADPSASPAMLTHVAVDRACRGYPAGEVVDLAGRALDGALVDRLGPANSTWNLLTHALRFAERADEARQFLEDGERSARLRGSHEATLFVEHGWGYWHRDFGSVAVGAARAALGLDVIRQLGMELTVPALAAILAENLLACDRLEEALAQIDVPLEHVADTYVEPFALSARALARFDARRLEESEEDLRRVIAVGDARGWAAPHVTRGRLRLATLLAQSGRSAEALELSDADLEATSRIGLPGVRGMVLRVRAMAVPGPEGVDLLGEAVAALEATPLQLELGWALRDLGARQRVAGHRTDARTTLRRALQIAVRTESTQLARLVRGELQVSGARLQRDAAAGVEGLTPSERRVADLAAEGLTNREIAQSLWVSPKTVEMHLGRVYAKLDIRSRHGLAAALSPQPEPAS